MQCISETVYRNFRLLMALFPATFLSHRLLSLAAALGRRHRVSCLLPGLHASLERLDVRESARLILCA